MANNSIKTTATIDAAIKGDKFWATLTNGKKVVAFLGGKIRRNSIRILPGDLVDVELSVYDLTKARITFRHKAGAKPVERPTGKASAGRFKGKGRKKKRR